MYNIVENPIPRSNLFHTPDLAELQAVIETLPKRDRALVYAFVMQTLNACNQLVEDQILSRDVFAQ